MEPLPADHILLYCRSGFEKETASEIMALGRARDMSGYVKAETDAGYIQFYPHEAARPLRVLSEHVRFDSLMFPRQWVFARGEPLQLPEQNRLTPLMEAIAAMGTRFSGVWLETADTNEAKSLSVFNRKFSPLLEKAMRAEGWIVPNHPIRLHIFLNDSRTVHLGWTPAANSSAWPMGIPRLRFPHSAPSRSTLKLEEAFLFFVKNPERDLKPGMTAVDLGAAPGGWTWQLVRRHIRTIAIDNGRLQPELLESGLVEHLRVDGFRYRPKLPVDWLVCDMAEQPIRIAERITDWILAGWCTQALFNLKLPMKKRYEEVQRCRSVMTERLIREGFDFELGFKQLYHDREEITGYVRRVG
ncbi:MAG: 23S rRNA (cytidine(2498)-2'-O)-methyltransferase RlmM [Methylococcaceae bacterium]